NRENLDENLGECGIEYAHVEELGGRRELPEGASEVGALPEKWRAYAAHMQTGAFGEGLDQLVELEERAAPVAVMCAEREPSRCHRQFIADALVATDREVIHLVRPEERRQHGLREEARSEGDGPPTYPDPQVSIGV
ncbi:MAG: DUF488 family protein, partial [Bradymonadaceae bacterium]